MVPTIAAFTLCRFALCSLDTCVWPSNSAYVNNCLTSFSQVLAMSPMNAGHCQVPVMQKQTTTDAWIKHRRVLEDALKKSRMDVTTPIALTFDKSSNHANDKRSVNHQCLFVTSIDHQQANGWITSAAVTKGVIGPCPLVRVTDMVGFDPDNRLGAASRTEQFLALSFTIRDFVCMLVTRIVCRAMIIHCFACFFQGKASRLIRRSSLHTFVAWSGRKEMWQFSLTACRTGAVWNYFVRLRLGYMAGTWVRKKLYKIN